MLISVYIVKLKPSIQLAKIKANQRHIMKNIINIYNQKIIQKQYVKLYIFNILSAKRVILFSASLVSIDHVFAEQLTPYLNLEIKAGLQFSVSDTQDTSWYEQGTAQIDALSGLSLADSVFSLDVATDSNVSYTLNGQVSENTEHSLGITEFWANYRPLSSSKYRHNFRFGSFYPSMSLENNDTAWTSTYNNNFSAINSWFAEELKVSGLEWSISRPGRAFRSKYSLTGVGGLFVGNDTIGSIISWRGFSLHSTQTNIGDSVYFANYPSIQSGDLEKQPNWVNPYLELDNRVGHYFGGHIKHRSGFETRLYHYDNNGDPLVLKHQQYAWDTRFDTVSLFYPLSDKSQFLAQWLYGNTIMGNNAVNLDYKAWFALLSHDYEPYKMSLRYDNFETIDRDDLEDDNNDGHGEAVTVSLARNIKPTLSIRFDVTGLNSYQANRSDVSQNKYNKDTLYQVSGQYHW